MPKRQQKRVMDRAPVTVRPSKASRQSRADAPAPKPSIGPKRGRPRKPHTLAEQTLHTLESAIRPRRRRISGKDRVFIRAFVESGFVDAQGSAIKAGYREKGIGWRLVDRLSDLIDVERVRAAAGRAMSVDEALVLCAERARTIADEKVALGYVQLILRANGALSDKPMPNSMRRQMQAQLADVVDRIQRGVKAKGGSARVKLRAMMGVGAEAEVTVSADPDAGEGPGDRPALTAADEEEPETAETTDAEIVSD